MPRHCSTYYPVALPRRFARNAGTDQGSPGGLDQRLGQFRGLVTGERGSGTRCGVKQQLDAVTDPAHQDGAGAAAASTAGVDGVAVGLARVLAAHALAWHNAQHSSQPQHSSTETSSPSMTSAAAGVGEDEEVSPGRGQAAAEVIIFPPRYIC